MHLREFVKATIEEIIDGVLGAQESAAPAGAIVNPTALTCSGSSDLILFEAASGRPVQEIKFDILVTSVEGEQAKAGAGIFVGGFGLGGHGKTESSSSRENRIAFKVPLALPVQVSPKA